MASVKGEWKGELMGKIFSLLILICLQIPIFVVSAFYAVTTGSLSWMMFTLITGMFAILGAIMTAITPQAQPAKETAHVEKGSSTTSLQNCTDFPAGHSRTQEARKEKKERNRK